MKIRIILLFIVCTSIYTCSKKNSGEPTNWIFRLNELVNNHKNKVSIKQGIYGTTSLTTGNCMPIIDENQCKLYTIEKEILIYERTSPFQVTFNNNKFVSKIHSKLIKKVNSDANGFFQIDLPVGVYSLFYQDDTIYPYVNINNPTIINEIIVDTNIKYYQYINIDKAIY